LQADNLTPELIARGVGRPQELLLKDDWNADVGGRIVADKLWFWAQVRWQRDQQAVQDCFQPGGDQCITWQRAY